MLIIGHRGAIEGELENSMAAFEQAARMGLARIEFDVHLAADGALCIMHDDNLERTTGRPGAIHALGRDEIKDYTLRNGEKIPFLDELLPRFLPLMELNVEIKTPGPAVVDQIMQLVEQDQLAREKIIFSSFEPGTIQYLSRRAPAFRRALLWDRDMYVERGRSPDPVPLMHACQSTIFHPDALQLTDSIMQDARRLGWLVFPYISLRHEERFREQIWQRLQDFGFDGLCTNFPLALRKWLGGR